MAKSLMVVHCNQSIPDWSLEDYRDTDNPYRWIVEHGSTGTQRNRYLEAHKDHCEAVGFPAKMFDKQYRQYCKDIKSRGQLGAIDTNFVMVETEDGDRREVFVEQPWSLTDSGVLFNGSVICRQPIIPVLRSTDVETGEMRLTIRYRRKGRHGTFEQDIPKSALGDTKALSKYARFGLGINAQNVRQLTGYLSDTLDNNDDILPEELYASRFGYIKGYGFSPYVPDLKFKGSDDQSKIVEAVTAQHGSSLVWKTAVAEAAKDSLYVRLCLAASLASPLIAITNSLPFFVHFWGGTGCGKTVACKFAASVWGNPQRGSGLWSTFSDTLNSLIGRASVLNQIPLIIDESEMLSRKTDPGGHIYALSEGVEKGRSTKEGIARNSRSWSCAMITCGESQLADAATGAGAIGRVIEVQFPDGAYIIGKDRKEADAGLKGFCHVIDNHYGFAGAEFTSLLYEPETLKKAREAELELRSHFMDMDIMDKQCDSAACLLVAYMLYRKLCMPELPELTEDDIKPFLLDRNTTSIGQRGYDFICGWVAENASRFISDNPVAGSLEMTPNQVYGRFKSVSEVYVIANVLDRAMKDAGFGNVSAVYSWMAEHNFLRKRTGSKAKYRQAQRIGTIKPQVYVIILPTDDDDAEFEPL